MTTRRDQKIGVLLSMEPTDKTLLLHGVRIAAIFRKELCLIFNPLKKQKQEKYKNRLEEYSLTLKREIPEMQVSSLVLTVKIPELPLRLADDMEIILLIAPASKFSSYAKAIYVSPVPFLFVHEQRETVPEFKKLVLPVDLRPETSDSAIWSSYFGRFNKAEMVVVAARDKNKSNRIQTHKNVLLAKKLFEKFTIRHKIYKGTRSSLGNAFEALELALASDADLFVLLGSSTITLLDHLIGLPEGKIIKTAGPGGKSAPRQLCVVRLKGFITFVSEIRKNEEYSNHSACVGCIACKIPEF